ncbi:MAG: YbeD family protein [Desulfuromonas sp.]|jgi:putative lipoic acid-binding regulatory protein|nr:DUF493 domain-containing protein [Desulfuromonas thiophila]MDD3801898.1 DUF493 domain-containing protein [Desulfuromonas thiophila]MDY0398564.1 DUF493 domain-containing protein [Desulfuromonas thiophila]
MTTESVSLQEFPCDYLFKAFGPATAEASFADRVHAAVNRVTCVSRDALRLRHSRQGSYLCVSIVVYLHNEQQRQRIYQQLRAVEGLKYLL